MFWFLMLIAAGWESVANKDGYSVERRMLDDADFYEVRVRAHCNCQPQQIFDVVWDAPGQTKFVKYAKLARVLRERGNERVIYSQNSVPVVKDRDYTVRSWYEKDLASGLIQIWWKAANDLGPPENPDHVRIKRTSGTWTFEPSTEGGTDVTYTVASEAGGAVPGWLVRAAQVDAAPEFVRTIIQHVTGK